MDVLGAEFQIDMSCKPDRNLAAGLDTKIFALAKQKEAARD